MGKIKAHMICHTHWDREWYLTREVFRTRLVRLIDQILDIVDTTPDYVSFMLDGQTIALEDYVEIRPENKDKLKKAVKSGKILSGPWYVLPDELLISGESHIRNYIIGSKVAKEYGNGMNVGYLPDSFGHPEQMPQIIDGLGMDTMIFWRGVSKDVKNIEFYWQSPYTGSKILCLHLPAGYGNSARLLNDESSISRLEEMVYNLHQNSLTDVVLLMNGSDHIVAQNDIVDVVKLFNEKTDTKSEIQLSTMEDYVKDVRNQLGEFETFTGEFRYGDRSMLLGGTLSTRMDLKQRNHDVQKKIERYLEPLKALEKVMGIHTPFMGYSDYIWKKILENHPHDSICGCSIDEVHAEMHTRFNCVEQLQDELIGLSLKEVHDNTEDYEEKTDAQLILFEPTQDGLPSYIEQEIDIDLCLVQDVNYAKSIIEDREDSIQHPDWPEGLTIKDEHGREVEHVILSREKAYYQHIKDETLPEIYKANRVKVGMLLPSNDFGVHVLNLYKANEKNEPVKTKESKTIENEFYTIEFDEKSGSLNVLDKKTNKLHTGVHRIVDKGDAGDEYTYSWPANDKEYGLDNQDIRVTIHEKGDIYSVLQINGTIKLPEQLAQDRKSRSEVLSESKIDIEVALYKGIDRIDFHTTIDNNAKDHRLQVEFPCGVLADKSSSSGAFAVTERDIELAIPDEWMEYPQSTHPNHGFVDVGNHEYGLSLGSIGLTEYEAENVHGQSYVRLTLLRCVGWLSRTDLITRKGNGGWTIETPEAQCLGRHEFEYSITYHVGEWRESNSYQQCERKIHAPIVQQIRDREGSVKLQNNPLGFISDLPSQVRISAVKPSENRNSIILRMVNISNSCIQTQIKLPKEIKAVYMTDLKEDRLGEIEIDMGNIKIDIASSQILTYELGL